MIFGPLYVFLDQFANGKFIRATGFAFAAFGTCLRLFYHSLESIPEKRSRSHPFYQGAHAQNKLYRDILGARLAVVTTPAEFFIIELFYLLNLFLFGIVQIIFPLEDLSILIKELLLLDPRKDEDFRNMEDIFQGKG